MDIFTVKFWSEQVVTNPDIAVYYMYVTGSRKYGYIIPGLA